MQSSIIAKALQISVLIAAFLLGALKTEGQSKKIRVNSVEWSDNGRVITIKDNKRDYKIEFEGEITVSDNDKDITAISNGGFIEIRKSRFGKKRRLLIEAEGDKLTKQYFVGRKEVDYNPEGREWLADILPDLVKRTTIAAKSRVERFYKKGGANLVMAEVNDLKSDYVKAAYIKILLKKDLSNKELVSVITTLGNTVNSDYYLAQILKSNQKSFLADNNTKDAYIKAASNIDSDYYKSQITKTVIDNKDITDSQMTDLLQLTKDIDSDYYKSQILSAILDARELNAKNMNTIMTLSRDIDSDHYTTQILRKALKKENLSSENYATFLSSISDIESDHYVTQILDDLYIKNMDGANLGKLLNLVSRNIESDYYTAKVYKKLASNKNLEESQTIEILENIGSSIQSAYYLSTALVAYGPKVKNGSSKLKEAYVKAARNIKNDTYYGRAMKGIY